MEKIAIVKIGAQSIKLSLFEIAPNGYYNLFDEITENIKIENSIEKSGLIQANIISETLTVLKLFRKICDANNVSKIHAIAESFLKTAKNQKSFLDEIYNNTGFTIYIYSSDEDVKCVYKGITNLIDVAKGIGVYVTPLQTHFLSFNRRNISQLITLDYGYYNLADKFIDEVNPEVKMQKMTELMVEEIKDKKVKESIESELIFIGAGSIFESLGVLARKITKYPLDMDNNYVVTKDTFDAVYNVIKGLDLDKTKKLKGVSEDRADSLASGLAIINAVYSVCECESISVCANACDEGSLMQLIPAEMVDKNLPTDMLSGSLEAIRTFYDREYSNTSTVYNLAVLLFKQLKVIHKLSRVYVKPLRIASSMYNCGTRIGFDNYPNKSFEIIINSKINGASQKDILIAAFACKAQNLDNISLADFMKYKDILDEDDIDAIRKLGVIIKLACSLDKSRMGNITDVVCDILGDSIIMKTVEKADAVFDILQAQKVGVDFKRVFKKTLEVI